MRRKGIEVSIEAEVEMYTKRKAYHPSNQAISKRLTRSLNKTKPAVSLGMSATFGLASGRLNDANVEVTR
jgi:hypothetical protein